MQLRRKALRPVQDRLADGFCNGFEHAVKNPFMKGIQNIPVQDSAQSPGQKAGKHLQFGPIISYGRYLKFQHGFAGCFHFRQ